MLLIPHLPSKWDLESFSHVLLGSPLPSLQWTFPDTFFLLNRILFVPGTYGGFAVSSWDDVFHLFRVSETKNVEVGIINSLCLLYIKRRNTLYIYEKIKYTALYAPVLF